MKLKLERGFTTCATCHRHLAVADADKDGNCVGCRQPEAK